MTRPRGSYSGVRVALTSGGYNGSLPFRTGSVSVIDQDKSLYYRRREAAERVSAQRASDARARRMHLEMASMYAKASQIGCSVGELVYA